MGTKFSCIVLLHGKHSFEKIINEVWYEVCDWMRLIQQTHIYILYQTYEYHLSHAAGQQMIEKKVEKTCCVINATKFGSKNYILHIITYHNMTSYGYIVMIIVD